MLVYRGSVFPAHAGVPRRWARRRKDRGVGFDLVEERWLPVVDRDGGRRTVGLAGALLTSHQLHRIVGETPTMTAALYRLVLALAHRAYGPDTGKAWADLWRSEELPKSPLEKYFARYRDRFDLFHPERPFLQCPAVKSCGMATTAKLVPYRAVGNNATLFDQTTASERPLLDPAEAARWLVTVHAYDTGGLKTPYGREKSSERAPCNNFGCVLVEGATLKDTLLLNMPVYNPAREEPAPTTHDDRPAWEDDSPAPEPETRPPLGWTDLLTWPSRRILLATHETTTGTVVNGVIVTPGTRLRGDLPEMELMAAFRRPPVRGSSKKAPPPLLPVRLRERRGVWRHSAELLLDDEQDRERQRPRTLDHVDNQVRAELIPINTVYTLRVFGQQLDKNYGAIECWFEEAVPVPVALLRAESSRVGYIIGLAVKLADDVGSALRGMERDYCTEFRAEPSNDLDLGYWPHLPQSFGAFLREVAKELRAERSEMTALEAWGRAVRSTARAAADQWAYGSPRRDRGLLVAGKQHASFTGRLEYLIKRFHAETTAFIAVGEAV